MTEARMSVDNWVELFRTIGLDDDTMHEWHRQYESRFPDQHQAFLEWLQLPEERIRSIREQSRAS